MRYLLLTALVWSMGMTALSAQTFTLTSEDVGGQATMKQVFDGFGCTGENVSPQLSWSNPPEGTKSYAITMYDPDAPTGSGFWHWIVMDIPASVTELATGAGSGDGLPAGAMQSVTSYGQPGYGGPCPPPGHGMHQYVITIHALKTESLGLDAQATPALVGFNLWQQTIEKASLIFYYERD